MVSTEQSGVSPGTSATRLEHETFRTLVECTSGPGTVAFLPGAGIALNQWAYVLAVLESLLDSDVSFAAHQVEDVVRTRILASTGCRASDLRDADCVLVSGLSAADAARWAKSSGSGGSATLVVLCRSLREGAVTLRLTGPGIEDEAVLNVGGIPPEFFGEVARRNANFRNGVDVILVAHDGSVACISRSSEITVMTDSLVPDR